MKKIIYIFTIFFTVLMLQINVSASSTTSAAEKLTYKNNLADKYGDLYAPAYSSDDIRSSVNVKSKAVESRELDFTLPGKNGMDIKFIRNHSTDTTDYIPIKTGSVISSKQDLKLFTYSSYTSKNVKYYIKVHLPYDSCFLDPEYATMRYVKNKVVERYTATDGTKYANYKEYPSGDIVFNLEKNIAPETHKCIEEMKCEFQLNYDGWYINDETNWDLIYKPRIVWNYCDSYYQEFIGFFMNENGEVFPISMPYKTFSGEGMLYKKPFFDAPVRYTSAMHTEMYSNYYYKDSIQHEKGFYYGMTITDYDGKTYYFNIKNSLNSNIYASAVSDRYGNFINYQTNTDTFGRNFAISDDGIYVDIDGEPVRVVSYESRSVTSTLDPNDFIEYDNKYYFTVKKLENAADNPDLSQNITEYEMSKTEVKVSGSDAMNSSYSKIDKITLPTGAKRRFTYDTESVGKSFEFDKKAVTLSDTTEENNTLKNEITYTYATGSTTAENTSSGEKTQYYIDSTYRRFNSVVENKSNYIITTSYAYNTNDPGALPQSIIYTDGMSKTTNYTYTNLGQITSAQDSFTNQTYTYGENGIITESTHLRDDSHKIRTVNTLTEDGKGIESSSIYEVNTETGEEILKETTHFTYDMYGNISSVTKNDGAGDITSYNTYTYNSDGSYNVQSMVEDVCNPDGVSIGNVTTYAYYDALGRCIKAVDANGGETEIDYDLLNRPVKITNADGTIKTISYNTAQNTVTETKENGLITKYEYTPLGKLKKVSVSENGSSWRILCVKDYDSCNRISSETYYQDYSGDSSANYLNAAYTYYPDGTPSKIVLTDKPGNILKEIQYSFGKNTAVAQAHNAETSGKRYNWIKQTIKGDDTITPYSVKTYTDIRGLTYKQELLDSSNSIKYQETYLYDRAGNLLEKKDGRAWSENWNEAYTEKYEYDYANRAVKAYNVNGDYTETLYNTIGLPVRQTDYSGNATVFEYDKLGRQIKAISPLDDSHSAVSKTYYDKNGNVIKSAQQRDSSNWIINENSYDEMNRIIYTKNSDNAYLQYFYDAAGNITDMVTGADFLVNADELARDDSFSLTSYTYDKFGNNTSITDPMGRTEFYAYDLFGNMKSKTDKNGAVFTFDYSPEGMLLSRTIQKDGETDSTSYTYDVLGNVRSASGPSGTINYTYDNFGRLTGESSGGIIKTYSYDLAGNRTQFNLTNNGTEELSVLYTYDKLNMLTSAVSDEASVQYTYDINGRPLTRSTGDTLSEYTYNNGGYLTSLTNIINNIVAEAYSYQYDLAGNRLSESKLYNGTNSTTSYTYDNVNRLKTVTEPDGGTISYDFDKSGNIAAKTMTHPSDYVFRYSENGTEYTMHDIFLHNILYTYNKNNELLREQNSAAGTGDVVSGLKQSFTYYTYDSNGNTLSRSNDIYTESYTYDMLNRLKAYTDAEDTVTNYVYDAAGKRVSKQTGSSATEFNWDGGYCVLEKTNGLTSAKNYIGIYGVFARSSSGEVTSFLKNGHGDVSAIVSDGQIVKTYAYDPYGQEKNPVSTDTNPFRYCGEYYDAETGNIYLRNRYYNPANGRFVTEDPIRDGINWYTYCGNNPIMFIDPLGLAVTDWDRDNCSAKDYKKLKENTQMWEKANAVERMQLAAESDAIRSKYRKSNEITLDNGWTLSTILQSFEAPAVDGNVLANISITYTKIYTDEKTKIRLDKVDVSAKFNGRIQTTSLKVNVGCKFALSGETREDTYTNLSKYTFEPQWDAVYYDGGAGWTNVGATATFTFIKGNNYKDIYTLIMVNNVDSTSYENEYGLFTDIDPSSVFIEALQRGER